MIEKEFISALEIFVESLKKAEKIDEDKKASFFILNKEIEEIEPRIGWREFTPTGWQTAFIKVRWLTNKSSV